MLVRAQQELLFCSLRGGPQAKAKALIKKGQELERELDVRAAVRCYEVSVSTPCLCTALCTVIGTACCSTAAQTCLATVSPAKCPRCASQPGL